MKLTSKPLAIIVFAFFFGGILAANSLGWWKTTNNKEPARILTGEYDPADIRGSHTFADISRLYAVPIGDLAAAFGVAEDQAGGFQVKSLETLNGNSSYELGADSVRMFTAWYRGLPYEMSGEVYLPLTAAQILLAKGTLSAEQMAYLANHTIGEDGFLSANGQAAPEPTLAPAAENTPNYTPSTEDAFPQGDASHTPTPGTVTGKTTFQDLLDWGLSREKIEAACGFPLPANLTGLVRDAVNAQGGSFSEVKTSLQYELNNR